MSQLTRSTPDGFVYRDLNKNGALDPYEDTRLPIETRIDDLLAQMTLAEKAGLMFVTFAARPGPPLDPYGDVGPSMAGDMLTRLRMNHFNYPNIPDARGAATWSNAMQTLAENQRLGIPITFITDPRHAYSKSAANAAVAVDAGSFSQWPEPIGLAAIGDAETTRAFGDIARQEYLAIGIRGAIHPMADLATEPRWARINGTFGEDAALASKMIGAYIRGFQGETLGAHSVSCMTKHFPGGGPQKDGEDPHFPYGKEQVYPGNNFDYHLLPFEAAFEAGTAQIMPYYGQPMGTEWEEVGFGYNKGIVTGLLRGKYGFDGVVCTDYSLVTDKDLGGSTLFATAWGVEHLSMSERVKKILDAGADMLGGETCPEVIVALVESGQVSEARIDESVRRILRDKFRLGLFDNPFVDVEAAASLVGNAQFRAAGALAQRRSIVLLKNAGTLPLQARPKIYVENIDTAVASGYGDVVADLDAADVAILRLTTPWEQRNGNFLERMFHAGDLDFKGEAKARILDVLARKPTVVVMHLDRPAVIPEIAAASAALLGEFGASDDAVLDVVFGRFAPQGKLPFELPSSMEAVRQQFPDMPYDSIAPLFPFGHGLTY